AARRRGRRRPVRPLGGRAHHVSGVHHVVPVLHRGDAVGRHTLRLRDATRRRGIESNIFVDVVQDETADETLPAIAYAEQAQRGDVVVYQFATASLMAPWLAGRSETLVVNYHNITPPDLIAPWDHHLALGQERAREDLAVLAPRTTLAIADSAYNEAHLAESGFAATAVVPPSAALDDDDTRVTTPTTEPPHAGPSAERSGAAWLAVGRVAPNKSLEHTIAALAVARGHADPGATLRVVGKPATDTYERALRHYVADLGLGDAVTFTGYATDAAVAAAYATSDVLVVTSEHEGFCVPVVEAMAAGLPVVAFDQGAVPEVLGGAGVLVTSRDPFALAGAIAAVLGDPARRTAMAEAGRRRLDELDLPHAADRFVDLLCRVRDQHTARRR
ncbi:MAG TPA: glycosyltransferase family 4 protein, partial [Acidimicrobiales bacterium]